MSQIINPLQEIQENTLAVSRVSSQVKRHLTSPEASVVIRRRLQSPDHSSKASSNLSSGVNCRCSDPAVKKTVSKDGANKGKEFWTCSEVKGKHCNFFK